MSARHLTLHSSSTFVGHVTSHMSDICRTYIHMTRHISYIWPDICRTYDQTYVGNMTRHMSYIWPDICRTYIWPDICRTYDQTYVGLMTSHISGIWPDIFRTYDQTYVGHMTRHISDIWPDICRTYVYPSFWFAPQVKMVICLSGPSNLLSPVRRLPQQLRSFCSKVCLVCVNKW